MNWRIPKFSNYIDNMKIKNKLIIIYLIAGLIPMLTIGSYLVVSTYRMIINQHNTQIVADNKRVRNILFNITYHCSNISDTLIFDEKFNSLLSTQYTSESDVYEAYKNYKLIDSFASSYTEISSIKVYVSNQTMINNGYFAKIDNNIMQSDWYRKVADSSGEAIWVCDIKADKYSYLSLIRKIPLHSTNEFAVLVISISNNYLKLMVDDTSLNTLFSIDKKNIFFSENPSDLTLPFNIILNGEDLWKSDAYVSKYNGHNVLMFDSSLRVLKGSNRFQIITIDKNALKDAKKTATLVAIIAIVCMLFPLILIFVFSNNFSSRINTLRKQMHKIAKGDLKIINNFSGTDELGELFSDMTQTIISIEKLNDEIYQEKLSHQKQKNYQQKIEFELLANQINPHFLFNTLETISMKAISHNEEEIAYITVLLGKLMRRALETHDQPVTLQSELNYIQTYLEIQHFRFGDRITYEIQIDKSISIDDYYILPLLLQPIIENAMIHGLEDKMDNGKIIVSIMLQESILLIAISDNGAGMNEDKRLELLKSMENVNSQSSKSSIGIRNVSNRIKLYYGEQYGINIQSVKNSGTTVKITLPSVWKGTGEYEAVNY